MTRIPLVCKSMVASAFQYGWAPTLIPATMTFTSPPAWVKVINRRSARATQSMFSVPLSMEIMAPEDRANHSTGTAISSARSRAAMIRAHSASATDPSDHWLQPGGVACDAFGQESNQGLGACRQDLDPFRVVGRARVVVEVLQMCADFGVDLLSGGLDDGVVEEPEPDASGEVADRGVAQLGGDDQPVEDLPHLVAGRTGRRLWLVQPSLEQCGDHRSLVGRSLLGQEHPVDRLIQLGTPVQICDPVVAKCSRQPHPERIRETLLLDVEGVQVGVEVLLWTVDALFRVFLGTRGPVTRQLAQVCEGDEQRKLITPQLGILREPAAQLAVLGDESPSPFRAHVIAGDHGPQRFEELMRPRRCVRRSRDVGRRREADSWGVRDSELCDVAIEAHQRRPRIHLRVDAGQDLSHPPGTRSSHRGLQLHAFEYGDRRSGLDALASRDEDRNHHRWRRRANEPGLVACDPMADAVNLDQVTGGAEHRDDLKGCLSELEPALEGTLAVDVDIDECPVHLHPVSAWTDLSNDDAMGLPPIAELDRASDGVQGPWSPTAG